MCQVVLGKFSLVPFLNQQEVQRHDLFFEHGDRSFHSYYTGEKFLNLKTRTTFTKAQGSYLTLERKRSCRNIHYVEEKKCETARSCGFDQKL